MRIYNVRQYCRICDGTLNSVLNLGEICLNDFVDGTKTPASSPLVLAECDKCHLVQLKHSCDLDLLYRQYWYKSNLNKSMVTALQNIVNEIEQTVQLTKGDTVIDIGVNDGTMISQYHVDGLHKVGFDPALNLADEHSPIGWRPSLRRRTTR